LYKVVVLEGGRGVGCARRDLLPEIPRSDLKKFKFMKEIE